jgi:hypothetical protein
MPIKRKKFRPLFNSNQGYRTIGGRTIYFRSGWEANFGRYLQFLKEKGVITEWEHEPKKFWFLKIKSGTRNYTPDFKVTRIDGSHYWVEVKGYMDAKSKTKLKRFAKYYPDEILVVIGKDWFQSNQRRFPCLTEQWENQYTSAQSQEKTEKI